MPLYGAKCISTSKLPKAVSGRMPAAARMAATSASAPPGRPAPYWLSPTALLVCALAAAAMMPTAILVRASPQTMGQMAGCSWFFQKGRAMALAQRWVAHGGKRPLAGPE